MAFSVLSDLPAARDILEFDRYSAPLLELLTSDHLETPLTIGVFGPWGTGKSTLLGMIERELQSLGGRFLCVSFNPWVFRKEPNLLMPLLHALRDVMSTSWSGRFKESAARMSEVLLRLGGDAVLRSLTADRVSIEALERYEKAYLERKGIFQNQLRTLRETLRAQGRTLKDAGVTIVLFIDDLDRCQPCEIVDLLESVKLFLDVENFVHILAVDKEIIESGIEAKYEKFGLNPARRASLGAEYLEKLIQIPVHLYPLHKSQVRRFISAHTTAGAAGEEIELLSNALSPNPRKIKRVLNAIAITEQAFVRRQVDWAVVVALVILRAEHSRLYSDIVRIPSLLIALQKVFGKTWDLNNDVDFVQQFGDKAPVVRQLCKTHYERSTMLERIFAVDFAGSEEQLAEYISVIGVR